MLALTYPHQGWQECVGLGRSTESVMDAVARITVGIASVVFGALVILTVKLGPFPSYFEDYTNIRGIRMLRRFRVLGYGMAVIGVLLMLSGLISAFIYGHLVNAP